MLSLFLFAALGALGDPQSTEAVCTHLSHIDIRPGERVERTGRSFHVSAATEHFWSVEELEKGWRRRLRPDRLLFSRAGVTVVRVTERGRFRGYVATAARGAADYFVNPRFKGTAFDRWFFNRVHFEQRPDAKCLEMSR